ncbi:hypothetical protein J4440_04485 [Candidatus Woesearchaeota archaeon]|nr:hypothetical protein [Candidatus Woesearchaeota archaeon]
MQIVEKALKELKNVMLLLHFGSRVIDSLLLFIFFLLLSIIFKFSWFYVLIPSIGYLIFSLVISKVNNIYTKVENKVPELNEQLRTAADNLYKSNPVVDSLKEDVVKNMKKVKTSYFINEKIIGIKLLILCGLSFLIVFLSFINVNFDFDLGIGNETILNKIGIRNYGQDPVKLNFFLSEGNISDILGNKSIAELGNKELQLGIGQLQSDADLSIVDGESELDFNQPNFPKEIYTSYDVSYNEKIDKENQKVVKNYFDQIIR